MFMHRAIFILGIAVYTAGLAKAEDLRIANRAAELSLTAVTDRSLRVSFIPLDDASAERKLKDSTVLDLKTLSKPALKVRSLPAVRTARLGGLQVKISPHPLRINVTRTNGVAVQELQIDEATGQIQFGCGKGPIFGLGEGGPQFDRRGDNDPMKSSQEAYNKAAFGGRMPVPWLVSSGWALFFHFPQGAIDLSGDQGRFTPFPSESALPIDFFVSGFGQPVEAMTEYAKLTGFPSMPPLWALGYEQSHRTIEDRDFVFSVAKTFREKQLPADVLIYLGTGWAPSGWNKGHRSFEFNPKVFPDPPTDIQGLKDLHFKVILHEMGPPKDLHGRASDTPQGNDLNEAANYWKLHVPLEKLGVDGWWPDEGENLSRESRLARIRMYWEGPQMERPNLRPYTLNRAGYAGMQRFGGWLWSGDLNSTWETLKNQVPVGINTALSGVPYWGTDIGGFFSTKELTGELYARWFEFGTFCPIFRSHGRPSLLRFPWSWNLGKMGEPEASPEVAGSALPDPSEFHNPAIEPICKKYLDLRYQMLPYIYSAAREAHDTGLPLIRALWLYYSDDPVAAQTGDEYLWGRDMLVAPITERGATSKRIYLPHGTWYDFWTGERQEGGRTLERKVDLATTPLYVRGGAILPLGPLKQYFDQPVNQPLTLRIYPGADSDAVLYGDDETTFNYEHGEFTRVGMHWNEGRRTLSLSLKPGSKMLTSSVHEIEVELANGGGKKRIDFNGKPLTVRF
jgi:alpha-glucosidase (family GH31 glycosyl hydrolase)